MAGPRKKPTPGPATAHEQEQQGLENEIVDVNEMLVDLEGRNPEAADHDGVQNLLRQLFIRQHINISQLSDIIIAQQGLGSVLRQIDDEDDEMLDEDDDSDDAPFVLGVTTVVNLTENKNKECVTEIINSFVAHTKENQKDKEVQEKIIDVLTSNKHKIGLLLNERFINIPAKIADPLLTSLVGELQKKALKNPAYNFDYLFMLCKIHVDKNDANSVQFSNAEEELFYQSSEAQVQFTVPLDTTVSGSWSDSDKVYLPVRRILMIDAKKFPTIVNQVKSYVA